MGRMWWIPLIVLSLAACSGDEAKHSDWELNEDDEVANNEVANNEVANNVVANNEVANNEVANNEVANNEVANNEVGNNQTNNTTTTVTSCLASVPVAHLSNPSFCDDFRGPGVTVDPNDPSATCQTDADCPGGSNGRCVGNGHDGYYCTYDECFDDSECGVGSKCECGGGFRSDHNVCLPGNCTDDADCGTGFCSPSQGDCGAYFGTVGYFCHTCEDECVNDSDCGDGTGDPFGSYCMYDQGVGHWRCSDSQCAG